jgi:hypothetical protein
MTAARLIYCGFWLASAINLCTCALEHLSQDYTGTCCEIRDRMLSGVAVKTTPLLREGAG